EDILGVQVLMHKHGLALRRRQVGECVERRVEQTPFERPTVLLPSLGEIAHPPRGFVGKGVKRIAGGSPEPRQQTGQNVEGLLRTSCDEVRNALEPARVRYAGVGQRYASGWRFFSDGSFVRISRRWARSSSAVITVGSSGACASTMPQGSTINERPYDGLPGR